MESTKKPYFYFLSLLICFSSINSLSGQNRDFKIILKELDSLAGFNEKEAIKRQKLLGIPESQTESFLEREKEEFIFNKFYSSLPSGFNSTSLNGSVFACGDVTPTPTCSLANNNVDFELGNTTHWIGFYGDFNQWSGNLGSSSSPYSNYLSPGSIDYISGIYPPRHRIVSNVNAEDPYGKFPIVDLGGSYSLKLGTSHWNAESEIIQRKFIYNSSYPYVIFRYAIVMEDPGHAAKDQPFFEATIFDKNCNSIPCATLVSVANSTLPNFIRFPSGFYEGRYSVGGYYKPWSYAFFDLSKMSGTFVNGDEYIVSFKTSDCALGAHFGYAYVELGCNADNIIDIQGRKCIKKSVDFLAPSGNSTTETYLWLLEKLNPVTNQYSTVTIPGGYPTNDFKFNYVFIEKGTYRITLTYKLKTGCGTGSDFSEVFIIEDCADDIVACEECIKSFSPLINELYSFEVWVREDAIPIAYDNFTNPGIQFLFNGAGGGTEIYKPNGPIINGWQRISGKFTIPEGTVKLEIKLSNTYLGERDVYFDDLRIYPSRGTVKSFVYNPQTLQLMAQLDENNFATYYEYNQEGKAIRVKVETEKGVFSVKEQGSFLKRK